MFHELCKVNYCTEKRAGGLVSAIRASPTLFAVLHRLCVCALLLLGYFYHVLVLLPPLRLLLPCCVVVLLVYRHVLLYARWLLLGCRRQGACLNFVRCKLGYVLCAWQSEIQLSVLLLVSLRPTCACQACLSAA